MGGMAEWVSRLHPVPKVHSSYLSVIQNLKLNFLNGSAAQWLYC
jgi:hypothetical protein